MKLIDPAVAYNMRRAAGFKQGSAAWLDSRVGVVTCSRLNDLLATNKSGAPAKSRMDYLVEKITERVIGDITDHYVTAAMQRGTDLEPVARKLYEERKAVQVREVGLIAHPRIKFFAGSPDGLVGDDGLIEIKTCATPSKFLARVLTKDYDEYANQIQGLMACTGRRWCDLVIYDDRFPAKQALHVARIERDEDAVADIEREVAKFLADLDELTKQAHAALATA